MRRFLARCAIGAFVIAAAVPVAAVPAHAAANIDGAGSTWSQIAVDQWRADVARQGLSVNYQGVGSTSGRVFYYQDQIDFAVSEIPFTHAYRDASGTSITDEVKLAAHRPYAYLPIVAGGTSFMYHIDVNGKRYTDLRLSPDTIARIFTGGIKNWNDPSIAADNPALHIPNLPIRPVVRSDGSGTTAQFTAFMAAKTPSTWNAFCLRSGIHASPCGSVSLWPDINAPSQQFSDGVADYVAAPYNNGAITYVEYGYALQRGFPVASVLNRAGFFVQPTAQDVAIALQGASLNPDGTQNLGGVYNFSDPRAYPVSSYSYMIVPTTTKSPFSAAKGETLSKFILYFVCVGQQKAAQLGYSPLPKNLVQVAFNSVNRIPGHVAPPPIDQCQNPTITGGFIAGNAPPPPASARQGAVPASNSQSSGTATGSTSASGQTTTSVKGSRTAAAVDATAAESGEAVVARGPVSAPPRRDPLPLLFYVVATGVLLLLVFGPPALALALRRRNADQAG